ncbi:glycosyltransferase family 4 protein [Parolsenella catena]|uniref:glycosyltransferase family 4 protein n=1 Tax=Parolsenella catena TaxID=2003188 RepID=UPI002E79829D|nr:glycosyltransferase family 4 protein [Parolsenella catena]
MGKESSYVLFSAQYPPHMGGIENFTFNLAHALVKREHSVVVVTNDTNAVGTGLVDDGGVTILRLPCWPFISGRFPLAIHNAEYRKWLEWLESQSIDGVLINARFYFHSLLGMSFAKRKGIRPIVLEHGSDFLSFSSPILDPIVRLYERVITSRGRRYNAAYYGVSQKSSAWLRTFGICSDGIISNSIDAAAYRLLSSGRDFRSELGLAKHFIVSFVGRLIPEKGIELIIEASKSNILKNASVTFVMAGDGPLAEKVAKAQSESLRWLGRLSVADVSALLQESQLLCLPSRSEGFSTILLESAACGCPAVVTDVGGARELIPDERYGTIIESMSASEIENAIFELTKNGDRLRDQAAMCQSLVESEFNWDKTAESIEQAFRRASSK